MIGGNTPGTLTRVIRLPDQPLPSLLHNVSEVSSAHQTDGVVSQSDPVTSLRLSGEVRQPFQGEDLTGVELTERTGRLPPADSPDTSSPQRDGAPGPTAAQGESGAGYQGRKGRNLQWFPRPRVQYCILLPGGFLDPEESTGAGFYCSITTRERNITQNSGLLRQPEAEAGCFVFSGEVASQGFTKVGVPGVARHLRNGCYAQLIRTQERSQSQATEEDQS